MGAFRDVRPALAYLAENIDGDVSLKTLAQRTGFSPFHFHRVFSEAARETPKQLALRLRLERGAAMLLTSGHSVLDIALACGFQNHESFSRAFRRYFAIAPSEYRNRGFAGSIDRAQAESHAALVAKVGPCVRVYYSDDELRLKTKEMSYSIEKKTIAAQPVLVVRRRVKRQEIAQNIAECLGHIFHYAQQKGIALTGHPFTRYPEAGPGMVTMEPGMRVALPEQKAVAVDPSWTQAAGEGEVRQDVLPGGPAAYALHAGPYDQLQEAYAAIEQWMHDQGLQAAGAPWEAYVTDPAQVPDPKDWKTEVFWPLKS